MKSAKATQIINAARFCDDNKPRFIAWNYWQTVVEQAIAHLANTTDNFDPEDAWWAALYLVRYGNTQLPEVGLKEAAQSSSSSP